MAKAKRVDEGDVIQNRVAIGLAKQQKLVAALLGSSAAAGQADVAAEHEDEDIDADLTAGDGDDEGFGVGAVVPKDIQDGTFTRRVPTSDDKLLQQLIGKKAAKAHVAAQKSRLGRAQADSKNQKSTVEVESEDEEEGRAAAFKTRKRPRTSARGLEETDLDTPQGDRPLNVGLEDEHKDSHTLGRAANKESRRASTTVEKAPSKPGKQRPRSYLDELLAERSQKKNKKQKRLKPTDDHS